MPETQTSTNPPPLRMSYHEPEGLRTIFSTDLSKCTFEVCLGATPRGEMMPKYRRFSLSPKVKENFRQIVVEEFDRLKKTWGDKDFVVRDFSYDSAQSDQQVEFIDLKKYPAIAQQIEQLDSYYSIPVFQGHNDPAFLKNLRFYVITVQPEQGSPIYLYRVSQHMRIIDHSTFLAAQFNKEVYDRVSDPLFLFDKSIDCLSRGNELYVFNKKYFCQIFNFWELLRQAAWEIIKKIEQKDLIHNFEKFREDCLKNNIKLLKLKNISLQSYLDALTIEDIHRIKDQLKDEINLRIITVDGRDKMLYEPKKDAWVILHVLEGAYVNGMLDNAPYLVTGGKYAVRGTR